MNVSSDIDVNRLLKQITVPVFDNISLIIFCCCSQLKLNWMRRGRKRMSLS